MRCNDGKLYRTVDGIEPFRLIEFDNYQYMYKVQYVNSGFRNSISIEKIVPYTYGSGDIEYKEDTSMSKGQLYKFSHNGTEVYGTVLATDSAGNKVMEIKGGGGVVAVDPKNLEKIVPYSVSVVFRTSTKYDSTTDKEYDFFAKQGELEVGDFVIIDDGSLIEVTAVDTKSTMATKWLGGWKVPAVRLSKGE